jgi:hypothetical protein
MFYVGLIYCKPSKPSEPNGPRLAIKVRQEPFECVGRPVAFNERSARVAVRRYIKGNLSAALVCFDDGINEPADARDTKYAGNLIRRNMQRGNGPGGYVVDDGRKNSV